MRKFLVCLLIFILFPKRDVMASSLDFNFIKKSEKELKVVNQNFDYPIELTPIVLKERSGNYLYILSTSWSWLCRSDKNILNSSPSNPVNTSSSNCKLVSTPLYLKSLNSAGTPSFNSPPLDESRAWMQSYNGIMGASIVTNSLNEEYLVVAKHNENQNFRFSPNTPIYKNSFFPAIDPANCVSGMDASGAYTPCWDSFTSFVSLGWMKLNNGNWDMGVSMTEDGPLAWPYNLMIKADGKRSGANFYHANLFFDKQDKGIYVFSVDHQPMTSGSVCQAGFRADSDVWPNNRSFKNVYKKRFDNNSLPSGFNKNNLQYWIQERGSPIDCIFGNSIERDYWSIYTDVARIDGTNYYLAVEEKIKDVFTNPKWTLALKVSADMKNWTTMKVIEQTNDGWGSGRFSYPRLFNSNGESNGVIKADNFFILGTGADNNVGTGGYRLYSMNLSINVNCTAKADFDDNRVIDVSDLIGWYGIHRSGSYDFRADYNCDGQIDISDLIKWYTEYRNR